MATVTNCPNCGAAITEENNGDFCKYCGTKIPKDEPNITNIDNSKSSVTYITNNYIVENKQEPQQLTQTPQQLTQTPQEKTKLCRKCGLQIKKTASKCPYCKSSQGLSCSGMLAAIPVALLILFLLPAVCSKGDSSDSQNKSSSAPKNTASTTVVNENNSEKYFETSEAKGKFYSDLGYFEVTGTIKNISGKNYSYLQITFSFYNADGDKVTTAFDNIAGLADGETWEYTVVGTSTDITGFQLEAFKAY